MEVEGRSDEEQRDDAAPTALLLDAAARTATLRHSMVEGGGDQKKWMEEDGGWSGTRKLNTRWKKIACGKKSHVRVFTSKNRTNTRRSPPHTLKDAPKPHCHPKTTTTAHDLNSMDYYLAIEPLVDLGCSILA